MTWKINFKINRKLIIGNNFKEKGQIELISRSNSDKIFLSKQEIENFEFEQYTP